jgi:hypothetical protein
VALARHHIISLKNKNQKSFVFQSHCDGFSLKPGGFR